MSTLWDAFLKERAKKDPPTISPGLPSQKSSRIFTIILRRRERFGLEAIAYQSSFLEFRFKS